MVDSFCPNCKRSTEVVFDHLARDTVCSECGLVLEAHTIDETSEWRTFTNESGDNDSVSVGGPTNPLLGDGGLSTVISKPNGATDDYLLSSLGRWQNRGSNPDRSLIQAFKTIAIMSNSFYFLTVIQQQHRVVIHNIQGEKLVGILHETGSKELVIVCHGFRSSKDRIPMVNLAAALQRVGISAFRFDFAGNGESEGSFQYGNYRREADDLRTVLQYFCEKERVIAAIIGHSKGGNVALLYASRYNDVRTIVNISGRFNLERGIEGRLGKDFQQRIKQDGFIDVKNRRGKIEYRVTEESLVDRLTTDTCAACLSIHRNCRILTVHGSMDEMVLVEDAMEFDKYIYTHKLHIIEGADHEYTSHQNELASIVLDFIKSGLERDRDMIGQSKSCKRADRLIQSRF